MILAPHALAGAAAAAILREHPIIAVVAAFLSHFLLDAVPHWHYKLNSLKRNPARPSQKQFIRDKNAVAKDILKTGLDFGAGLSISILLSLLFFPKYFWLTFWGAAAGALPDLLQFLYYIFPNSPLSHFQRFHKAIHAEKNLDDEFLRGTIYQLGFSLAVIIILIFSRRL